MIGLQAPAAEYDKYAAEFASIVRSLSFIGSTSVTLQSRQEEMAAVWQIVMSRLKDLDGLDAIIDSEAQQDSKGPIAMSKALILDNGHLRTINDSDKNLAPNHFMLLEYQRDLVHRTSTIVAFDSQEYRRRVFSYTLPRR